MDNTNLFTDKAEVYSRFRPSYPMDIIRYLSQFIHAENTVADIGAGTGKFTKMLCHLGCNIIAVEPNTEMLLKASDYLLNYPNVTFVKSPAEDTNLADNSVDLITCAQSFHWFDTEAFKKECIRILKPNGKVMLLWNTADYSTEIVKEMNEIHKQYCDGYTKRYSERSGLNTPLNGNAKDVKQLFFCGEYENFLLKNDLEFNKEAFIGNRLSRSYAPKQKDKEYKPFVAALESFFAKYQNDGKLIIPNITECYIGKVI